MEIRPVKTGTERLMELTKSKPVVHFRRFANAPKNENRYWNVPPEGQRNSRFVTARNWERSIQMRDRNRYDMIYLLTAIVLTPGGSSTVHIYTQTVHRTTQKKKYTEQHKMFWKSAGRATSLRVIPWHLP